MFVSRSSIPAVSSTLGTLVAFGLAFLGPRPAEAGAEDDVVAKSLVILKVTPTYAEARALAAAAAERLAFRLDLRELGPDPTMGLTFGEEDCLNEFGEFPCYVPRGRFDDGVYLSVEHSSSYAGLEEGQYLVVLASGSPHDRVLRAALRRAKGVYPDATIKTTPVYLGCIH